MSRDTSISDEGPPAMPPLADADWPVEIADLRAGFAGGLNVYRVMARHPALLRAWAGLRDHVVNRTALGPELSEVAILRGAVRLGSTYEWKQHVERARARGLSDVRIASIRGPIESMSDEDAVIAAAVDALFTKSCLPPRLARAVLALKGEAGLLDLTATVGFYATLGYILNTLRVPLDEDIAAALSDRPLSQT